MAQHLHCWKNWDSDEKRTGTDEKQCESKPHEREGLGKVHWTRDKTPRPQGDMRASAPASGNNTVLEPPTVQEMRWKKRIMVEN